MQEILDVIVPAIAVAVGFYLKRQPWYATKFVPVASYAVAVLVRLFAGLLPDSDLPAAGIQSASLMAIGWSGFGAFLLDVLKRAIVDAILATGAHSGVKNVVQGIRKSDAPSGN